MEWGEEEEEKRGEKEKAGKQRGEGREKGEGTVFYTRVGKTQEIRVNYCNYRYQPCHDAVPLIGQPCQSQF